MISVGTCTYDQSLIKHMQKLVIDERLEILFAFKYHSKTALLRYMKRLENLDLSLSLRIPIT